MTAHVLAEQGAAPLAVRSLYGGETGIAPGLAVDLWSHAPSAYPAVSRPGGLALGGASISTSPDGSTVSAIIDTASLLASLPQPIGPIPAILEWTPADAPHLDAGRSLAVRADLRVLASSSVPGGSSSQAVVYLFLRDDATGATLALGQQAFDSRGAAGLMIGTDGGAHGTGDLMLTLPAGAAGGDPVPGAGLPPLGVDLSGAAAFQARPWAGWRSFALVETPATLAATIALENRIIATHDAWTGDHEALLSTDPARWQIVGASVDTEIEYDGSTQATLAYSARDFAVATLDAAPRSLSALDAELWPQSVAPVADVACVAVPTVQPDPLFLPAPPTEWLDAWARRLAAMAHLAQSVTAR